MKIQVVNTFDGDECLYVNNVGVYMVERCDQSVAGYSPKEVGEKLAEALGGKVEVLDFKESDLPEGVTGSDWTFDDVTHWLEKRNQWETSSQ